MTTKIIALIAGPKQGKTVTLNKMRNICSNIREARLTKLLTENEKRRKEFVCTATYEKRHIGIVSDVHIDVAREKFDVLVKHPDIDTLFCACQPRAKATALTFDHIAKTARKNGCTFIAIHHVQMWQSYHSLCDNCISTAIAETLIELA